MPFTFTNSFDGTISLLWQYSELDVVCPSWKNSIRTLSIVGVDNLGKYPDNGRLLLRSSRYDDILFEKVSNNIRELPLINIDLEQLFPNVVNLSLTHLNINNIRLPDTLRGWVSTDTYLGIFNVPTSLYWLTLIHCFGCWERFVLPYNLRILNVYGDYCNNFKIPPKLFVLNLRVCKINRLTYVHNVYSIREINIHSGISPYDDIHITKNLINSNVYKWIQHVIQINNRLDAEQTTNVLVLLRTRSMTGSASLTTVGYTNENHIHKVMMLGSNYPRRAMEFMAYI